MRATGALAMALLVACGGSAPAPRATPTPIPATASPASTPTITRNSLGRCAPTLPGTHIDREPGYGRLASDLRWYAADDVADTGGRSAAQATVELRNAVPLAGGAAPATVTATLYAKTLYYVRRARDSGRRFVVGLEARGRILLVGATDDAGDVVFVGECESRTTRTLDEYVAAKGAGRTHLEVLRDATATAASRKAFADHFVAKPPPTWHDLPPERRQIDLGFTPRDVLATLSHVRLRYEVPDDWRRREIGFCGRIEIGWTECTSLDGMPQGPIELTSYAMRGRSVGLWAQADTAAVGDTLGRLCEIPSATVDEAIANGGFVVLRPAPGVVTYDDLRTALREGRDALLVAG